MREVPNRRWLAVRGDAGDVAAELPAQLGEPDGFSVQRSLGQSTGLQRSPDLRFEAALPLYVLTRDSAACIFLM